jgi:hypothetical protein
MKLIAGLAAALVIVGGVASLVLIKGHSSSSKVDHVPEPVPEVAPSPETSPTPRSIAPPSGDNTGGKCINPPLNTICVR